MALHVQNVVSGGDPSIEIRYTSYLLNTYSCIPFEAQISTYFVFHFQRTFTMRMEYNGYVTVTYGYMRLHAVTSLDHSHRQTHQSLNHYPTSQLPACTLISAASAFMGALVSPWPPASPAPMLHLLLSRSASHEGLY